MITLNNVSKKFKNFSIKDISINIYNGEYLVILGPSGSGKTVILELIANFISPDNGTISGTEKKKIGFIYQDFMLFPHLNVYENIGYGLIIRKEKNIDNKVRAVAKKLEIENILNRDVQNLSGGEKQRVAIARAFIISPQIFLLDEPTSSFDVNIKSDIQQLFSKLHKDYKSTFVHVTHNFEEALILADRIVILQDGEVVQVGTPNEIFDKPNSKYVADFIGFKNIFFGNIVNNKFYDKDFVINVIHEDAEKIYTAINSKDIIISNNKIESSARNCFKGEINLINKKISIVEVSVNVGKSIVAHITYKSFEELDLFFQKKVWITFKSSSVVVF
ncbi:MAG: ATP-binding cassette domain-containing protein [Candidatus Cloacimonadota bacterium]|nr:ATP-binding cassette domain-containing protein [Candidatus Cloacimonadota bacterium]